MKILFNNLNQQVGRQTGTTRYGFALLQRLIERGTHDYALLSPFTRADLPASLRDARLDLFTRLPQGSHLATVLRQSLEVPRLCRTNGIDLLVNLEPVGSPRGGKRRITIAHDFIYQRMATSKSLKERLVSSAMISLVLNNSDRVVAISRSTYNDMTRFFPFAARKAEVIYNASTFDVPLEIPLPAPEVPFRYVLAVGNATLNKNFSVLAGALSRLDPAMGLGIVHVGIDPAETIQAELERRGANTPLLRMQNLADTELAALFRNAVCLVAPSLFEGFCLPVIEAQGQGCPVIFSRDSATGEIAGDGGLAFDPRDIETLSQHLRRVASDQALRKDLISRGFLNHQRFSWKRTLDGFERLFTELGEHSIRG